MRDADLPPYIERPGDQSYAPPYVAHARRLTTMLFRAEADMLDDLLESHLNVAFHALAQHRRRPFAARAGFVAVMDADIERLYSTQEDYVAAVKRGADDEPVPRDQGSVTEREVSIWIPVEFRDRGTPEHGWYLPRVFTDSPQAVATGRELYGYMKEHAFMDEDGDRGLEVRTVIPTDEPQRSAQPFLRLHLGKRGGTMERNFASAMAEASKRVDVGLPARPRLRFVPADADRIQLPRRPPSNAAMMFVESLLHAQPIFFLRQIRDPWRPTRASLQQLVMSRFVVQARPEPVVNHVDEASIEPVHQQATCLLRSLGLRVDTEKALGAPEAIEATGEDAQHVAFTVDRGRVIYDALH